MNATRERLMHANSLVAYWSEKFRSFSKRERLILGLLASRREIGTFTDREIKDALGFCDMNSVRPRITELIKKGELEEWGSRRDSETGKMTRRVRIALKC